MRVNKNRSITKRSNRMTRPTRVRAGEEIVDDMSVGTVNLEDAATDLLFEAEDVAELVAEVTGEAVEVTVDDDAVVFAVGGEEYTVEPDGDEEIVESCTRMRGRRVAASRRTPSRRIPSRRIPSRRR